MRSDGRDELRHKVRSEEPPPSDAAVVIRGGPDTPSLLRTHARRLHRQFVLDGDDVFGISVFVALDDLGPDSETGILTTRIRTYPTVYRTTVGTLQAERFEVLPTFKRPHFTVVLPKLDAVDRLANALGPLQANQYNREQ